MHNKINAILKQYFGYDDFRSGQRDIIEHILGGTDVLGIMPTGAGKSVCYQVPALTFDGITIVISPLISLMKDQVDTLKQVGVRAAYINSTLNMSQLRKVTENAKQGMYKLIYVAPERLETDAFMELVQAVDVSMVAVDEAHCVSQWGHDFRPSYVQIAQTIEKMSKRPVLAAFTATATPEVKKDIINLLELKNPYCLTTGFDRENLYFEVKKPSDKYSELLEFLNNNRQSSGIVYASTRKTVDSLYEKLSRKGFRVSKYHAGLSENERSQGQEAFICDSTNIMIATNAFGMGIDKSNISYVIHYNMPKNMESYYQEAGRAGRDGEYARCILLYSAQDIITNKLLIENSGSDTDKSYEYSKLNDIVAYCNTDRCLRSYILEYFGELGMTACDNCGNCSSDIERTDVTLEAQKIMSCVKRMGERFGAVVVSDVLRGANTEKVRSMGFDRLPTYGIMKDYSKETIKELIAFFTAEGYLESYGDQYPVLKLNSTAYGVLNGQKSVTIKRSIPKQSAKASSNKDIKGASADRELFEVLRGIRKDLADQQGVPPFVIFSDATLKDMCRKCPTTAEQMLSVSGVGAFKLDKYGERFINAITGYMDEKGMAVNVDVPVQVQNHTVGQKKQDTKQATYELYKKGLSIEQIAQQRSLAISTIESHLLECMQKGLEVVYEDIYPGEYKQQILEAIKDERHDGLKSIKEALPETVSYGAIRFLMSSIGKSKREN